MVDTAELVKAAQVRKKGEEVVAYRTPVLGRRDQRTGLRPDGSS